MKTAILTLYCPNYSEFSNFILPNWKEYCAKQGYSLITRCEEHNVLEIGFAKMRFLYDEMFVHKTMDVAMVLDLDILVTNLNIKVSDFLDEQHDYFVTTGFNGLCNGSFIIKNTERAKTILQYIINNEHRYSNEQDMLKYHLNDPILKDKVKLFPYNSFGSFMMDLYPEHANVEKDGVDWKPGDFLLHLPGLTLAKRIEVITSDKIKNAIIH